MKNLISVKKTIHADSVYLLDNFIVNLGYVNFAIAKQQRLTPPKRGPIFGIFFFVGFSRFSEFTFKCNNFDFVEISLGIDFDLIVYRMYSTEIHQIRVIQFPVECAYEFSCFWNACVNIALRIICELNAGFFDII